MKQKRYLKLAILYFVLLSFLFPASHCLAAENIESPSLHFTVIESEPTTLDSILAKALENLGYKLKIESQKADHALFSANTGSFDGLVSHMPGQQDEYDNLLIVDEPIGFIEFCVYARKGVEITADSWESLKGLTVGMCEHYSGIDKQLDGESVKKAFYSKHEQLLDAVRSGEIDVAIIPRVSSLDIYTADDIEHISIVDRQPIYTYVNQKNEALAEQLADEYKKMKENGLMDIIYDNGYAHKTSDKQYFLHIMSYGMEIQSDRLLDDGIRSAILLNPASEMYSIALDANKGASSGVRMAETANLLRTMFSLKTPDVIIASDAYALELLEEYYQTLFFGVPVIYYGLKYGDSNIFDGYDELFYSLYENLYAAETVSQMLKLFPNTKELYVINDYFADGRKSQALISEELKPFEDTINIQYNEDLSLQNMLNKLNTLSDNTLVLLGTYNADVDGSFYSSIEINTLFGKNCAVPMFGLSYANLGYGQVGGYTTDRFAIGSVIGDFATDLAFGIKTNKEDFLNSLQDASNSSSHLVNWFFDGTSLKNWNISERKLPFGAVLLNEPPSGFELGYVFLIILISSAIIIIALAVFINSIMRKYRRLSDEHKNSISFDEIIARDAKINEVNQRLEAMIESAPLAYALVLEDGFVIESNTYSKQEIGISPGDKIQNFYTYPGKHISILNKLKNEGTIHGEIQKLQTRLGNTDRFHLNYTVSEYEHKKAVLIWGINIEKGELQKDNLNRTQLDLQKVIDALPVAMQIIDFSKVKLLYGNSAYLEMFKLENDDFDSIDLYQYLPDTQPNGESSASCLSRYLNDVMRSSVPLSREIVHISALGERIESRTTCMSLLYKGEPATVLILQDITAERRQAEMLKNTAEKEKEANQLKSRFIVNMSHEIRTPMNAIIGLTEIELLKSHSKETCEIFKKINMSSRILLTIVNDILDFSKIEAKKLVIVEEKFELNDAVSTALFMASQRLTEKHVELITEIDCDIPAYIYGDKTRTWQIIKNILDNSAKFTDNGNIKLSISLVKENTDSEVLIQFEISDTGKGMSEENLNKLYTPFVQFHTPSAQTGGTGLGMSITNQLAELMGGSLNVESKLNIGTTVTITIPYRKDPNTKPIKEIISSFGLKDKRLLFISDNNSFKEIFTGYMQHSEMKIVSAAGLKQALQAIEQYEKSNNSFDVVVIDDFIDGYAGNTNADRESCLAIASALKERISGDIKLILTASAYAKNILKIESTSQSQLFSDILDKPHLPNFAVESISKIVEVEKDAAMNDNDVVFINTNVLLCEDNLINQEVASGMLSIYGIEPVIAENGKEALEYLEKQSFDLIFLDILMPVMDGHKTAVAIRQSDKPYKNVPIIAMTANVMKDEIEQCFDEGMNGHISKPIQFEALLEQLEKWLPKDKCARGNSAYTSIPQLQESETSQTVPSLEYINIDDIDLINSNSDEIEAILCAIGNINFTEGLKRFGNKKDKYINALYKFAGGLDSDPLLDYNKALENADETKRIVHTLKGTSGNLSIYSIHTSAAEFESTLKNGTPDEELYNILAQNCIDVKTKLLQKLRHGGTATEKSEGSISELKPLLSSLKEYLIMSDAKMCDDTAAIIKEKKYNIPNPDLLNTICEYVDGYDYDNAIELIDDVYQTLNLS